MSTPNHKSLEGFESLFHSLKTSPKFHISSMETFKHKLSVFLQAGPHQIQGIFDFDYTLTNSQWEGRPADVSYGILSKSLDEISRSKAAELTQHYLPLQQNPDLEPGLKRKYLEEWHSLSSQLFVESGLTKAELLHCIAHSSLHLRAGAVSLLELCSNSEVPVTIVSAGVGDVISQVLPQDLKEVEIIANYIDWDADKTIQKFQTPTVLPCTKAETLRGGQVRPYLLVLGDSLDDVEVVQECEHSEALFIGFVTNPALLEEYKKRFDLLIIGDESLEGVTEIVRHLFHLN